MSYQDELREHLVEYKRSHLGISEPGLFRYRGRDLQKDHILPVEYAYKNLLEEALPAARAFLEANSKKRHQFFHHLNSSQAFAFNLFFPYFSGGKEAASALLRALGQSSELASWEPEAIPEPSEGSNIDVLWDTTDGCRTFCEVKLSEADFGKALNDSHHRSKFEKMYKSVLERHLDPRRLDQAAFFNAYQFNRNVWHMARTDGSKLVFLLPKRNVKLWNQLQTLVSSIAPQTRERISSVAIEDVLEGISSNGKCPDPFRKYARSLGLKYLVRSAS